jgi:carbamoyltransferase
LNVLGISTKTHDSGIALLSNGVPAFVYEEERFNREKHTLKFPNAAARKTQATLIVNQPGWIRVGLYERFGYSNLPEIVQVPHHDAHAAVFFVSPFEEATVLVMDGYGDDTATSANIGVANRIDRLWHDDFFDSLGMLYTCVTEHLGFEVFQEGIVMALAAYGGPTYAPKFGELIHLNAQSRLGRRRRPQLRGERARLARH